MFGVVRVRPEAALVGQRLSAAVPSAGVRVATQRGLIAVNWTVLDPAQLPLQPFPPAAVSPPRLCSVLPQFPVPAGGLINPNTTMELGCAGNGTIGHVDFALWGKPDVFQSGWYCFGPQPPPTATMKCAHDVSAAVGRACVGRSSCVLSATTSAFGDPCPLAPKSPPGYQLAVRVACESHSPPAARPSSDQQQRAPAADGALFTLSVQVPASSTGDIHVPKMFQDAVTICESGAVVWRHGAAQPQPGVTAVRDDGRFVIFRTTSGQFRLTVFAGDAATACSTMN